MGKFRKVVEAQQPAEAQKGAEAQQPRFGQGLFRKQSLITTAILVLGLLVIAGFYNQSAVRYFREQSEQQAGNLLRQTQAALEGKTAQFHNLIRLMYLNADFQNLLFNEYYYDVPALVASRQIVSYFAPVDNQLGELFAEVDSVTIYTTNPTLRMIPGQLEPVSRVIDQPWYKHVEEEPSDRTLWLLTEDADGRRKLSAIHRLRNLRVSSFSANDLGYVKLDFDPELFFAHVLLPSERGAGWTLVTGLDNQVIAASRVMDVRQLAASLFSTGEARMEQDMPQRTLTLDGIPHLVWAMPVAQTDWTCWYAVSEQTMRDAMRRVNLPVLIVLLVMTTAMISAALFSTSRLTRRIGRLAEAMEKLEGGDFGIRVQDRGKDEIGVLSDGFNTMSKRLGELVKREYLARMRQREYDLNALAAQLHPHFLYNTLASISWLGMQSGLAEIPAMSNALARFYRLSLSKGRNFIRVADEISQVKAYLDIMGIRYKDKILASYQVSPEVVQAWTLKLVLQPFVENAILHGLTSGKNHIAITLTADPVGEDLRFTVSDDGVGIPEEKMHTLLDNNSEGGYGIANVDRRIHTYFGEPYGIAIHSVPGEGTSVTLCLPLMMTPPVEG